MPLFAPVIKIFQRPYALFQFCNGAGGVENCDAPTVWLKTVPKRAKPVFCFVFDCAPRILTRDVTTRAGIVALLQNYNIV